MDILGKAKNSIVRIVIPCIEWAMAAYVVYYAFERGVGLPQLTWTFNVAADLICILVNLFLIMGVLIAKKNIDQKYSEFLLICHANFLSLFMDFASWMMDGVSESRALMLFINSALYISNLFLTAAYARFIVDVIGDEKKRKKAYLVIYIFLAVTVITRLLNIKFGYFFTVSPEGVYSRGPYQYLSYIYTIFIEIFVMIILIRSSATKTQKKAIFVFTILPFISAVVSIFIYGLSLMYACVLVSIVMMYSAFFVELEQDKDKLIENFEKYISNDIVQKIVNNPGQKLIEGRRYTATVLISDIRGFTAMSESMSPQDLIDMINHYYEVITEIINSYGGVVTEFLGDGIMCIFGAPKYRADHADAAVAAALKIEAAADSINKWNAAHNYPEIRTGIGINTGNMVIGSLGYEKRAKYTAVGQAIDRAFEIESCSIGGQVLISSSCLRSLKNDAIARFLADYRPNPNELVKIKIYEITGLRGEYDIKCESGITKPEPLYGAIDSGFHILVAKTVGEELIKCKIKALSDTAAVIETDYNLNVLDNIELKINNEEAVFAKVEDIVAKDILVAFTSKKIEDAI